MDATDETKATQAREETYRRYVLLHNERADKAVMYLHGVQERYQHLGEIEQQELLNSCLRMLIDLQMKKRPTMDIAATFLRYVLLAPVHMRVPFVNAVASCCEPLLDSMNPDAALMGLRKRLHTHANKMSAMLYDLTMELTDWRLRDPAQMEMFKPPQERQPQTIDDGGVVVDLETGQILDATEDVSHV